MANIEPPQPLYIFVRNYSLSHCGAGIHRASGAFEIRGTPRFALWRRNPPGLPAHSQSELRPPEGTRAAETGRRRGRGARGGMPLEELGVMLCVWLAWGAQLAQMALQSQREDE